MTPKEKAEELLDKMYNTENCGIKHFPNKNYCDCSEINFYQSKQCALICVNEVIKEKKECSKYECYGNDLNYWQEVKTEIENL